MKGEIHVDLITELHCSEMHCRWIRFDPASESKKGVVARIGARFCPMVVEILQFCLLEKLITSSLVQFNDCASHKSIYGVLCFSKLAADREIYFSMRPH